MPTSTAPMAALAPWVGVYGIGFLAAVLADALAQAGRHRWVPTLAWIVGAGAITLAAIVWPPMTGRPEGPPLPVALLQGNIPQDEKFEGKTGVPLALRWYAEQMTAQQRRAGGRARDRHSLAAPAIARELLRGDGAPLPVRQPGAAGGHSARQHRSRATPTPSSA